MQLVTKEALRKADFSRSSYQEVWDDYVEDYRKSGDKDKLPGDEWGTPESWTRLFNNLFIPNIERSSTRFVEIGAGAGKYTKLVLDHFRDSSVHTFDVSPKYTDILIDRFQNEISQNRVFTSLIDENPKTIRNVLTENAWTGKVDCFYSIDAMVHVDLQYLIVYLLTAADVLNPNGTIILTLADATSDRGFKKLVGDIDSFFKQQGGFSYKFEWQSPDLIANILGRLGFTAPVFFDHNGRDIAVAARLKSRQSITW